jgi:hypothetical protein
MSEAELMTAMTQAIQLGYSAGQWWVTITTALLVGVHFAGKLIPRWLFAVILVLYALNVLGVIVESISYNDLSSDYGTKLVDLRLAHHAAPPHLGTENPVVGYIDTLAFYLIYVVGGLSAVAYCITVWRKARHEVAMGR